MNYKNASILVVGVCAIACSRAPEKGVAAPQSAPTAGTARASSEESAKEKKASADLADERDDAAEPAAEAAAPAPMETLEEEESPALTDTLADKMSAFDQVLLPEQLSCSQAGPLRDAICNLADRICKDGADNALKAEKSCNQATQSCKDVKARFKEKCQ